MKHLKIKPTKAQIEAYIPYKFKHEGHLTLDKTGCVTPFNPRLKGDNSIARSK